MKAPFHAVSSPRIPSGVGWIGVGLAVGMIVLSTAKRLVKGDLKLKRGTRKPEPQPKAQMKSESTKPSNAAKPSVPAAKPPKPAAKSSKPTARRAGSQKIAADQTAPKTDTAIPTGREEVRAQKDATAKRTQAPPKKSPSKVPAPRKKTTPGLNTNPKNPRTHQA